ncbi:expressed unknown protein [Seminavis robusta]|uniref:Uncharacterized protein n=1 Tax=Seminavis robusta TaxID=568900 RepID=A0A9N8DST0_9STRA|nr:expressed unknown protein [Seminavis robusta]|eukprot:Sro252_g099680.1 n/a (311) ;mRNA; r:52409-53341
MPTPQIMLPALGDVLSNFLYGFHESDAPTNAELTKRRRDNMVNACERLLADLVGPGDLLDSQVRHEIAMEAYGGFASSVNMRSVMSLPNGENDDASFAEFNQTEIKHNFVTNGPFRDVALAIVNFQHHLDENFFGSVVQRLQKTYKDHSLEDCRAMAMELTAVAAGCDAVRTFCAAAGIEDYPPLPGPLEPVQPARFSTVADYAVSPLQYNSEVAWGPFLTLRNLRPEIVQKFQLDTNLWKFGSLRHAPISNVTAAPLTCQSVMKFFEEMYVPLNYFPRFLRVPGPDRHLARGQIEPAAATYTTVKHCRL